MSPSGEPGMRRPLVTRVLLALVALGFAAAFLGVGVAAWTGGEVFLAAMGALGALITVWVVAITLRG